MEKATIFVDMDNTVADLTGPWMQWVKEAYGKEPGPQDSFHLSDWYPDLTKDDVYKFFGLPSVFENLPPIEGAIDVLNKWEPFADIWFATVIPSRHPKVYGEKLTWIKNHFPKLKDKLITFSSHDKTKIYGDFLIDDHPDHIKNAVHCEPIVFDMPWNRNIDTIDNTYWRANSWHGADGILHLLCQAKGLSRP